MLVPDLEMLLANDTTGELLDWGSGVICAKGEFNILVLLNINLKILR